MEAEFQLQNTVARGGYLTEFENYYEGKELAR